MVLPTDVRQWVVLVVDDQSDFTTQIERIMTYQGATVHTAASGVECLEKAAVLSPTMIITDLSMPGMDGWRELRELRDNPITAAIPVVAITAYHSSEVEKDAVRIGFDAYFSKPINAATFVSKVAAFLSG